MTVAERYLELLSSGASGWEALESTGGGGNEGAPLKGRLLDALEAEIDYVQRKTGVTIDRDDRDRLLRQADDGITRLVSDGPDARLDDSTVSGLEAVVRTDGSRPVLFVEDDFVDVQAPSIGAYAVPLSRLEDAVRDVCRSVGRVDDPAAGSLGYQGTAWVVGDGLVATNYHVLQAIAPGGLRVDGVFRGRLNTGVAVHFGHEVGNALPDRRFPIRRVVAVGREGDPSLRHPQRGSLNFDALDLAVLELEPVPGRSFPPPVAVARGDDPVTRGGLASNGRGVYLVGYPGNEHSTTPDLFASLFAGVKSFKRLAPGVITRSAGEVASDPRGWILEHDASTLGGNSGSALVDLDSDGRAVLGLHFAGLHARTNWAHATERITDDLAGFLPTARQPDFGERRG